MEGLTASKVVRRVRKRIEVSQEGLARLLNATKGAVQHWERGRNNPDLARLNALRQLCPPGPERKDLDNLIKQTQSRLAPLPEIKPGDAKAGDGAGPASLALPGGSFIYLRRENHKLQRQVTRLEALVQRRTEQLRILEDLATELQREMAKLRAAHGVEAPAPAPGVSAPEPE
jgi:transcriptional regulator with XRE-family HTH domain